MICFENPNAEESLFDSILGKTLDELNIQAKKKGSTISKETGTKLELKVFSIMQDFAVGTKFEGTIVIHSGFKFPDIVAKKYYGVEVKTTTQNHWVTIGNSVMESTRIDEVKRIYLLFGKLAEPVEFRCKPYAQCLSDVVVTHSPRYQVDMTLKKGNTFFDRLGKSYEEVIATGNPIKPIVQYFRDKLKPGDDIWWINQETGISSASSVIIKVWNNLEPDRKRDFISKGFVYFPEILSNRGDKFDRIAVWLSTRQGIVCPNIRDPFTAGGRADLKINGKTFKDLPRIYLNLFEHIHEVVYILKQASPSELFEHWEMATSNKTKINDWINLVDIESKKVAANSHLNLKAMILHALS